MNQEPNASFEDLEDSLRQSWELHRQAFGPILEPAFTDDPQARLQLTLALNHISRRDVQRGMQLLKQLRPHCVCDEDHAAWAFFVGVGFEMLGDKEHMQEWYRRAGEYHHGFYLPYLKLAKAAHAAADFEAARELYEKALDCLLRMPEKDADIFLGATYTNLTSCLTMLHRYPAAEQTWKQAQRYPRPDGSAAAASILYAAMGDAERCARYLELLKAEQAAMYGQAETVARQILRGEHPAFPPRTQI